MPCSFHMFCHPYHKLASQRTPPKTGLHLSYRANCLIPCVIGLSLPHNLVFWSYAYADTIFSTGSIALGSVSRADIISTSSLLTWCTDHRCATQIFFRRRGHHHQLSSLRNSHLWLKRKPTQWLRCHLSLDIQFHIRRVSRAPHITYKCAEIPLILWLESRHHLFQQKLDNLGHHKTKSLWSHVNHGINRTQVPSKYHWKITCNSRKNRIISTYQLRMLMCKLEKA